MFRLLDTAVPVEVLQGHDPASAVASHFGLRPRGWDERLISPKPQAKLERVGRAIAEKVSGCEDLHFVKLNVVWVSEEQPDRLTAFRDRTGLDSDAILRRPVVSDGAKPEDWGALFTFALGFGWDAAVMSRRAGMLWFSHDEYLRATPAALVRGLEKF